MENNDNQYRRQKEVQRLTLAVLAVLTVIILGYVAYGLATQSMNILVFSVLLGSFVVIYLVLSDIVEPYRLGTLENLAPEQRSGFLKMLLMDLIGGGALIYWITGLGSEAGNDILIPFLVYFLTAQLKRKYRAEFEGTAGEESSEESADEAGKEEEAGDGENIYKEAGDEENTYEETGDGE